MSNNPDPQNDPTRPMRFSVEDWETSEWGRDPRFPSGWWLLPVALGSFALIVLAWRAIF